MRRHIIAVIAVAAAGLLYGGATSAALPQGHTAETERTSQATDGLRWAHGGDVGVLGSSADPDPGIFTADSGNPGGYAEWTEDGDTLKVCDIENTSDGTWHARAYVYVPDGAGSGTGQVLQAVSDLADNGSCSAYFENISETVNIEMKVCVTNSSGAVINDTCNWTLNL